MGSVSVQPTGFDDSLDPLSIDHLCSASSYSERKKVHFPTGD